MDDFELTDDLRDELRAAWQRYLDRVQPFRPLLHGYCQRLTRQLWDAEDLAQETLIRGFHALAYHHDPIENPRAYLLRIATHAWIDQLRRRETEQRLAPPPREDADGAAAAGAGVARDAGRTLLQRLAPRERAAVILKDLFDMSLEETAVVLETSVGAVKAALHRGRGRLHEPEDGAASRRPRPSAALLDRFIALYQAADVRGLVALMLDGGSIENVGCGVELGRENFTREDGWFQRAVFGHPEWPAELQYTGSRFARAELDGEPILLGFTTRRGREALEQVLRIEEVNGRIARLRGYAFCPETMREIGERLGLRVRTGLYRYPTPAPGAVYAKPS